LHDGRPQGLTRLLDLADKFLAADLHHVIKGDERIFRLRAEATLTYRFARVGGDIKRGAPLGAGWYGCARVTVCREQLLLPRGGSNEDFLYPIDLDSWDLPCNCC
jgi:hypothetical protein